MPRTDVEQVPLGVEIPPTSIKHPDHESMAGMSTFHAIKAPSHLHQPLLLWLVPAAMPCIPKTRCGVVGNP